jgi:hypothetical protein
MERATMPLVEKDGTHNVSVSYYPNDKLAEMIAQAWIDPGYKDQLLKQTAQVFKSAGIFVDNPLVVTESDFKNNSYAKDQYTLFVLPDAPTGKQFDKSDVQGNLIETARIKMAYTLLGI